MSIFHKFDRALREQRRRSGHEDTDPESLRERQPELEKHDFLALWLSAMITIFPAALGALALLGLLAWLLIPR